MQGLQKSDIYHPSLPMQAHVEYGPVGFIRKRRVDCSSQFGIFWCEPVLFELVLPECGVEQVIRPASFARGAEIVLGIAEELFAELTSVEIEFVEAGMLCVCGPGHDDKFVVLRGIGNRIESFIERIVLKSQCPVPTAILA